VRERVPEHVRVQVRDSRLSATPAYRLVDPITCHYAAAIGKPVSGQVSALVGLANTLVPVQSPCGLMAERHDTGAPTLAHDVSLAPFDAHEPDIAVSQVAPRAQ